MTRTETAAATCARKKRFNDVSAVLAARERMGAADRLNIYYCEPCAGLHLGGDWDGRVYTSWEAAAQAASDLHRARGPLRVRINRKPNGWWLLRTAPALTPRSARTVQVPPPPLTSRMDLRGLRIVGGV